MGRLVPDAITSCVGLMMVLGATALLLGNPLTKVLDSYYQGLWMLLPFTMQMTLIITLSAALASTPFFRSTIERLSRLPRNANQVMLMAVAVTAFGSYLYWGFGIAGGPIIAVHFAREAERKGIAVDFPFLLACIAAANAPWQFGLSASAPLLVATEGHFLEKLIGVIPLSTTIWSPAAILHTFVFVIVLFTMSCRLMPASRRPISAFPAAAKLADPPPVEEKPVLTLSERVERQGLFAMLLSAALLSWLYVHIFEKGRGLDINSLNTTLLLFTVLLHGSVKRFTDALQHAVLSAWPVIVLYHLYAGVAGLIQFTSVGETIAWAVANVSNPLTFPLVTALNGALFSLFIPSSGGQWAIQGFVTAKSAMAVGVTVQRGILALSVGDHMGNLASPFWYVVIGGIARVDFRTFFGYGLLFAAVWFVIGVVVFTFAPC